jgi:hypothetical protein
METNEILFAEADDIRLAVSDALGKIGKTFAELEAEAASGRFSSERACLTWMAVSDLREYAPA